jgi:hypothetical protein
MESAEIDLVLKSDVFVEPYELLYAIYMYTILLISLFLTLFVSYVCFNKESKLSRGLKIIFLHSLTTNFTLTIVICLSQVEIFAFNSNKTYI